MVRRLARTGGALMVGFATIYRVQESYRASGAVAALLALVICVAVVCAVITALRGLSRR